MQCCSQKFLLPEGGTHVTGVVWGQRRSELAAFCGKCKRKGTATAAESFLGLRIAKPRVIVTHTDHTIPISPEPAGMAAASLGDVPHVEHGAGLASRPPLWPC